MKIELGDLIESQYLASARCMVAHFAIGHGQLEINVTHPEKNQRIRLGFSGVEYFSGPVRWQGA
ncbi:MAG TPA: hypothetical protein VHL11_17035, partial [Phototrophicaceae bacterium]|nr:hypothetical protein [Phototrophicaceae bacterium]